MNIIKIKGSYSVNDMTLCGYSVLLHKMELCQYFFFLTSYTNNTDEVILTT